MSPHSPNQNGEAREISSMEERCQSPQLRIPIQYQVGCAQANEKAVKKTNGNDTKVQDPRTASREETLAFSGHIIFLSRWRERERESAREEASCWRDDEAI